MSKLIEALKSLDTANDAQWTSEGLPLLDAVSAAYGSAVTRADIAKVAPKFTRKNPEVDSAPVGAAQATQTAPAGSTSNEPAAPPQTEPTADSEGDSGKGRKAAEAKLKKAREALSKAQKDMQTATDEMDVIIRREAQAKSGRSGAEDIKAFQASQREQRATASRNQAKAFELLKENGLI